MPDILLVEDKASLRRVLRLTLENAGYSVTEAGDARAAINEISCTPQIVLTDLRMPHGSGLSGEPLAALEPIAGQAMCANSKMPLNVPASLPTQ